MQLTLCVCSDWCWIELTGAGLHSYMMEFAIAAQPADLHSTKERLDMKKFEAITTQDARNRHQNIEKHNRELFGLIDESDGVCTLILL